MADYKYINNNHDSGVIRYADNTQITENPINLDWREYLVYVEGGGLTDDYMTIDELKSSKASEIIAFCDLNDSKPFEYPESSGVFYKVTSAVLNTLSRYRDTPDADPLPVNDGKWDNYNSTVSTPFTMGEFKDFYDYGYDIPADNYDNMKIHIYIMMQLETSEEVQDYDFSAGWR